MSRDTSDLTFVQNVNAKCHGNYIPLQFAAINPNIEIVKAIARVAPE